MNERIKELAEQAGLYFYVNGKLFPQELTAKESIVAYERFAELIVKECGRVQHERFCKEGDVSWDLLMQHFGIEE